MGECSLNTSDAMDLFMDGTWAFHQMNRAGWRIDLGYLNGRLGEVEDRIGRLDHELIRLPEIKTWRQHYGADFNLDSSKQKSYVLFKILKYTPVKQTGSGGDAADKEVLADIDAPFAKLLMERGRHVTVRNILKAIRRETVPFLSDESIGILRPNFCLNTASSYRSSCTDPNNQNWPIRDAEQGEFVRRCLMAAPGWHIGEHDSSGQEVRIAACYCKDPNLITYILDKTTDMHRDAAAECFMCRPDQVSKKMRYCGKNKFVFPEFYGDWYKSCAKALWKAVTDMKLTLEDGTPLMDHMKSVGIGTYARFEKHIQDVEHSFWYERFDVYRMFREDLWARYLKDGEIHGLTGFSYRGEMRKNEVLNLPIQGSAFHVLLWILIRTIRTLDEEKAATQVIGQVHDSIISHIHPDEIEWYDSVIRHWSEEIRNVWPWIIVPLEFEADIAPAGMTWFDKKKWPWKQEK